MPTTLTGLLIFVALLAPGFAFLVIAERGQRANLERSALRETATIVLASLGCDTVVVVLFAAARWLSPANTIDPTALVTAGRAYVVAHMALTAVWSLTLFGTAVLAAVVLAGLLNRPAIWSTMKHCRLVTWIIPAGGNQPESAWWKLLKEQNPKAYRLLTVTLEDWTVVRGWLLSHNSSTNESTDRELALAAPLSITRPDGRVSIEAYGAMTIHASRILFIHVDYRTNPPTPD